MKRPKIVTAWAFFLAIAAAFDLWNAFLSYGISKLDYFVLNPGVLAFFRPIAWAGAVLVPVGLFLMRRWAIVLYPVLQGFGAALTYLVQPEWLSLYPSWAIPVSLTFPVLYLMTLRPSWPAMTAKVP